MIPMTAPSIHSVPLSDHARSVLEKRFLRRDERGQLMEDPAGLFRRVGRAIAAIDCTYGDFRREESEEIFVELMSSFTFLPNSPTLMNGGIPRGQLAGCFVLPIEDSMESIYGTLRDAAMIQKTGGGTGFSFSHLRPRGDYIRSTRGVSSGPVSFMRLYDYSTQVNRLGGTRAGANMGVLRHDHPDILEFVSSKRNLESLPSFNISVMATDEFMRAVNRGEDVPLRFPADAGEPRRNFSARSLFDQIVANAWETGDPGLLFYDRINAANPTPHLGEIEATNPCGEQPLLPYESCNLGSINVARFARSGSVDYDRLAIVVAHAVHFLDNVLDANVYPVDAVRRVTLSNRKIGLGIMGFADLLVELRIPYASEAAVSLAEELMSFVQQNAKLASANLARSRSPFPSFAKSRLASSHSPLRNACVTSIAPTGTISLLAGCSSGIEPFFALSYRREVIGSTKTIDVHPSLIALLSGEVQGDLASVLQRVRATGRLDGRFVSPELAELFSTAHEISPEWHVRMQAAFQRHTDTSVSKTINLRNEVAPGAIAAAYQLAFETGCKGVTVFRDGCKTRQVLRAGLGSGSCPECGELLVAQGGCQTCASCGYSICTI
jgi:ribonucleoside-diphosphate reductase alpha chain